MPAIQESPLDLIERTFTEMYAVVRGECPSLLNEDSGGSALLAGECLDALEAIPALRDQIAKLADERAIFAALVRKLEAVHADPCRQLESLMIHGGRCVEPTYTRELEAAQAALEAQ